MLGTSRLIERTGAGEMADVWRADQLRPDRYVAIKVLRRYLASQPGSAERFAREARAISRPGYPNSLAIHDISEQDGFSYMVSPFVEGGTHIHWNTLSEATGSSDAQAPAAMLRMLAPACKPPSTSGPWADNAEVGRHSTVPLQRANQSVSPDGLGLPLQRCSWKLAQLLIGAPFVDKGQQ